MGIYINPKNESKEQWLESVSEPTTLNKLREADYKTLFPVVWVDNGHFTAAAVADSPKELHRFVDFPDSRPMKYYLVSFTSLKTVLQKFEIEVLQKE